MPDLETCVMPLSTPPRTMTLDEYRDQAERLYLSALLDHAEGNISRMARIAKVTRMSIYRLLKKHGLEWRTPPQPQQPAEFIPPALPSMEDGQNG